jgi:hypothetical protein
MGSGTLCKVRSTPISVQNSAHLAQLEAAAVADRAATACWIVCPANWRSRAKREAAAGEQVPRGLPGGKAGKSV